MIKTRKLYNNDSSEASDYSCEYCNRDCEETEIQEAYVSGTYICGEIECWNEYMFEWAWTGNTVECTTEEYECCDDCEEEIEECICESEEE